MNIRMLSSSQRKNNEDDVQNTIDLEDGTPIELESGLVLEVE